MPSISRTWTFSSVSTRAFIASVSTALRGRQGLQQPLGLTVGLGPAAHSMLAWLRFPPCSAMNTFSTTRGYIFVRVNCPTSVMPRRKKSAHPVR